MDTLTTKTISTKTLATNIRIIKIADCGKLTTSLPKSLTYNIGVDNSEQIHFRVTDNKTGGLFSTEWVALDTIESAIKKLGGNDSFHANIFERLYEYRSANNSGFLAAALLAEGILHRYKKTKRLVTMGDVNAFKEAIKQLIDSDISLNDIVAERLEERKVKETKRKETLANSKAANAKSATKSITKKPTTNKATKTS